MKVTAAQLTTLKLIRSGRDTGHHPITLFNLYKQGFITYRMYRGVPEEAWLTDKGREYLDSLNKLAGGDKR